jgi:hypothetical protein
MVFFVLGSRVLTASALVHGVLKSFKLLKRHAASTHFSPRSRARSADATLLAEAEESGALMFFVVFSLLMLSHEYIEFLIDWLPFYYLVKCAVLVWIQFPGADGARYIFEKLVRPILDRQSAKYGPKARRIISRGMQKCHRTAIDLCIQGADDAELARLQESVKEQLKRVRAERETRAKTLAAVDEDDSSAY